MKEEKLNLRFVVHTDEAKTGIDLSGIPRQLWEDFVKRCARKLPNENPDTAWSKIIGSVVQSEFLVKDVIAPYIGSQKAGEHTFLMAGIPLQARDALDMYANQANLTPDLLVALMYQTAMTDSLHILNLKSPEEHDGYHMLVTSGISNEAWAAWSKFADKLSDAAGEVVSPEELLGHIFERVLWGDVTINTNEPTDPPDNLAQPPKHDNLEDDVSDLQEKLNRIMEQMKNGKS